MTRAQTPPVKRYFQRDIPTRCHREPLDNLKNFTAGHHGEFGLIVAASC